MRDLLQQPVGETAAQISVEPQAAGAGLNAPRQRLCAGGHVVLKLLVPQR